MAKKTAVKLLYKLLPQTERMSVAVKALNEHEGIKEVTNAEKLQARFTKDFTEDIKDMIICPNTDASVTESECDICEKREGCPSHAGEAA
jgi:recombinational DNA repair protein RecT